MRPAGKLLEISGGMRTVEPRLTDGDDARIARGLDGDLRADAGGIADGHGNDRQRHV